MSENRLRNLSPADVFVCLFSSTFFGGSGGGGGSLRYFGCVESPKCFASRVRHDTTLARVSSSRPLRSPSTNHTSCPLPPFSIDSVHTSKCSITGPHLRWPYPTLTIALKLFPSKWGSKWTNTPPTSARAPWHIWMVGIIGVLEMEHFFLCHS